MVLRWPRWPFKHPTEYDQHDQLKRLYRRVEILEAEAILTDELLATILTELGLPKPIRASRLAVFPTLARIDSNNMATYPLVLAVAYLEADGSTTYCGLAPQTIPAQAATADLPAFPAVNIVAFDETHVAPANLTSTTFTQTSGDGTYTPPATPDGISAGQLVTAADRIEDVISAVDTSDNLTGEFDFQAPPVVPIPATGLAVFPLKPTG